MNSVCVYGYICQRLKGMKMLIDEAWFGMRVFWLTGVGGDFAVVVVGGFVDRLLVIGGCC
jgi:hypothetical protein